MPRSAKIKVGNGKGINHISDDSLTPLSISIPMYSNKSEKMINYGLKVYFLGSNLNVPPIEGSSNAGLGI